MCNKLKDMSKEQIIALIQSGDLSDGYHTFNELYDHRAILFAVVLNSHPEIAWKSKAHEDGSMFENMFVCGIETPTGQFTYHYYMDKWDMFKVKELECAPHYDGHTPEDVVRLLSIPQQDNF